MFRKPPPPPRKATSISPPASSSIDDPEKVLKKLGGVDTSAPEKDISILLPTTSGIALLGVADSWSQLPQPEQSYREMLFRLTQGMRSISSGIWLFINGKRGRFRYTFSDDIGLIQPLLQASFSKIEATSVSMLPNSSIMLNLPHKYCLYGVPTFVDDEGHAIGGHTNFLRLLGATNGEWRLLLHAQPVNSKTIADLHLNNAKEMEDFQQKYPTHTGRGAFSKTIPDSLEAYDARHERLANCIRLGGWYVWIMLLADARVQTMLPTLALSTFIGEGAKPNPLRVCVPQNQKMPGTLLTSHELAVYLQIPRQELPGFRLSPWVKFDVMPANPTPDIVLGEIVKHSGQNFGFDITDLRRHALVVGMTGSGKSNTCQTILAELGKKAPSLVIESAKREYRNLGFETYTLGSPERPLRINPFAFPVINQTMHVQMHIDYLKALFKASFVMTSPMPQVLEQCLYEIYEDAGWDLLTGKHERMGNNSGALPAIAFPTLTNLYQKIEPVVIGLGYDSRISLDLRAALKTRINSLRFGAKGYMLDVPTLSPIEQILSRSTVLELESIPDDEEKAFIIGLLLIQLYEYRMQQGQTNGLRGVLLIEEAHHLLNRAKGSNSEEPQNTSHALNIFINLLAEVRAFGQGIVIADQLPSKLTPEIIKNSNIKICHRLDEADERRLMAGAMVMNEEQERYLALLQQGEIVIYLGGEDASLLVKVNRTSSGSTRNLPATTIQKEYPLRKQSEQLQHSTENLWLYLISKDTKLTNSWPNWQRQIEQLAGTKNRHLYQQISQQLLGDILEERCRDCKVEFDKTSILQQDLTAFIKQAFRNSKSLSQSFTTNYLKASQQFSSTCAYCASPCIYYYEVAPLVNHADIQRMMQAIDRDLKLTDEQRVQHTVNIINQTIARRFGETAPKDNLGQHLSLLEKRLALCLGVQVATRHLKWDSYIRMVADKLHV